MGRAQQTFLVGTSGWMYPHWKGVFYPQDWPQSRWFQYYSGQFRTVEVNATFYRFFKDQTYHNWYSRAPADFLYVLKAPRIITHRKYLQDVEEEIKGFWSSASILQEKLGLILLQLAPSTPYEPERLKKALLAFGDPKKISVEFRHKRWLTEETRELLNELGSVFCSVDSPKIEPMDWVTSDIGYIRLHGREAWYAYDYSDEELEDISKLAEKMRRLGANTVYIFFNNDLDGCAPRNAQTLIQLLSD